MLSLSLNEAEKTIQTFLISSIPTIMAVEISKFSLDLFLREFLYSFINNVIKKTRFNIKSLRQCMHLIVFISARLRKLLEVINKG